MKKKIFILVMVLSLLLGGLINVSANSLDEAIKKNEAVEQNQDIKEVSGNKKIENNRDSSILKGLKGSADFRDSVEGTDLVLKDVRYWSAYVIQIIIQLFPIAIVFRTLFDIAYIKVPFVRPLFYRGKAVGGDTNGMMGNQGMGGYGGFGRGGFGRSGFGRGGFGRGGFGMMGNQGMAGYGGQTMGQQGNVSAGGGYTLGIPWVSLTALRLSELEGQTDENGKLVNTLSMYKSEMVGTLVLVPIILVLLVSGTLSNIGFTIGEFIVNNIDKLLAKY